MFPVWASYMGNPALPGLVEEGFFFCSENMFAVKAGYQRDWVFDRGMKAISKMSGRIDDFGLTSDQGVLILNIAERVDLYGTAGAARFLVSHRLLEGCRDVYRSRDQLMWGAGVRALLATWGQASCGIQMNYECAQPKIQWMTRNGSLLRNSSKGTLCYHAWQVGFGGAYQMELLSPYIGVKYSNVSAEFKNLPLEIFPGARHFTIKNRRKFGVVMGTTFSTGAHFSANVEVRVIDEQSLTLAADMKF